MARKLSRTGDVPVLTAAEAVALIPSCSMITILGSGDGLLEPSALIEALGQRYSQTRQPNDLTLVHVSGIGDRGERGLSNLALEGMFKRVIGGHWGQALKMAEMAAANEFEAYCLPQGILSHMFRVAAQGGPGVLTHVGLGTFMDPRQGGGKLNARATDDIVRLMEIDNREMMFYPVLRPTVALIRGTTADTEGYISLEDEPVFLDVLSIATAVRNAGGIVLCQVQRMVKAHTLHPKSVRVPGFLVDAVVVVPDQPQVYARAVDPYAAGHLIATNATAAPWPLDIRKVLARRALMEVTPGDVINLGVGMAGGLGPLSLEEGVGEFFTFTVEHGPIGGTPQSGGPMGGTFGCITSPWAILDQSYMFDFYHGGGLDACFLSFAEFDRQGNVNVHAFSDRIMGTGGFIDISQNAKRAVFCGSFTADGIKTDVVDGALRIRQEGKFTKVVDRVKGITFNGVNAVQRGQPVTYITERAVFRLTQEGVALCEIAPGVDLQRDILDRMEFTPVIAPNLRTMDPRIFRPEPMGLAAEFRQRMQRAET